MDFIILNKACPKDSYSLPRIDQLVDIIAGHQLLSFMDAFLRYIFHHKLRFVLLQSNVFWFEK